MKRFLAFFLVLIICFSLASCNNETGGAESSEPSSMPESSVPESSVPESSTPESSVPESSTPESSVAEASVPEEEETPIVSANLAAFNANTKNGYSILEQDGKRYCVDSKGFKVGEIPSGEINVTNVYNGVFMTYDGSKVRIRKTNGEEIKIPGNATTLKILFATDTEFFDADSNDDYSDLASKNDLVNALFKDGYILAVKLLEGSTGYRFQMGVIGLDGKWKHNLSFDNPLLREIGITDYRAWYNLGEIFGNLDYCGEGILRAYGNFGGKTVSVYYDIEKNVTYKLTGKHLMNRVPIFKDGVYIEEVVTAHDMSVGTFILYSMGSDGKLSGLPAGAKVFSFNKSNLSGAAIYSSYDEASGKNYYIVCNIRGNTVKQFEAYDIADINPIYGTNTAQILIYNADGSYNYTKIDANGNFLFNPIKISGKTDFYITDADGNTVKSYNASEYDGGYANLIAVKDDGTKAGEYKNADIRNGIIKSGNDYIEIN